MARSRVEGARDEGPAPLQFRVSHVRQASATLGRSRFLGRTLAESQLDAFSKVRHSELCLVEGS